jgi:hypothetical protein
VAVLGDGFVAAGYAASPDGDLAGLARGGRDGVIVRFDAGGNYVWTQAFGGSDDDSFAAVTVAGDGLVAVGRLRSSDGDLPRENQGYADALVVGYDTDGNRSWARTFGGSEDDWFSGVAAVGGGVVAAGTARSEDGDLAGQVMYPYTWLMVRYDLDSSQVWVRTFGGTYWDWLFAVAPIAGGFVAAGEFASTDGDVAGLLKGGADALALRCDEEGDPVGLGTFGGSHYDMFAGVVAADDGFVAVGLSSSTDGDGSGMILGSDRDAVIVRYG